jgi:hypothetical protein
VKANPKCAAYVKDKNVTFQIQTASGEGRYFEVKNGKIKSHAGQSKSPSFTFTFKKAVQVLLCYQLKIVSIHF